MLKFVVASRIPKTREQMMKSPFTGKEMKRVYERRTWNFRGEPFEYIHTAWLCEDSGEQFTNDESDMAAYLQVVNQYETKYGKLINK